MALLLFTVIVNLKLNFFLWFQVPIQPSNASQPVGRCVDRLPSNRQRGAKQGKAYIMHAASAIRATKKQNLPWLAPALCSDRPNAMMLFPA